jgi:hypothetical protein
LVALRVAAEDEDTFDQATPVPLRRYLKGHLVRTAAQQGSSAFKNGNLLAVAEQAGFDLLLTTDQNMGYQQSLAGRKIAIVVLDLQQRPKLVAHVDKVVAVVDPVVPGTFIRLDTDQL